MANYTEKELANVPADELIEIIIELQEIHNTSIEMLRNERKENKQLQKELNEASITSMHQLDQFTTVDLGLDVLRYKIDKGNLQLVQKFEQFLQRELNTVTHREIYVGDKLF